MIIDHSSAPDFSDALPLPFCPFPVLPDVDESGDQDAGKRTAVGGRPRGACLVAGMTPLTIRSSPPGTANGDPRAP